MRTDDFWRQAIEAQLLVFRHFAKELEDAGGYFDMGRREAYREIAEALAFVLEDNRELAS